VTAIILLLISSFFQTPAASRTGGQPVLLRYKFTNGQVLHYIVNFKLDAKVRETGSKEKSLEMANSRVHYLSIDTLIPDGRATTRCQMWFPNRDSGYLDEQFEKRVISFIITSRGDLIGRQMGNDAFETAISSECLATNLFLTMPLKPVKPGDRWKTSYTGLRDDNQPVIADMYYKPPQGSGTRGIARLEASYTIPIDTRMVATLLGITFPKLKSTGGIQEKVSGNVLVKDVTDFSIMSGRILSRKVTAIGSVRGEREGTVQKSVKYTSTMTILLKKYAPGDPMPPSLTQHGGGTNAKRPAGTRQP
jgi:hypothetical protein